MQYILSTKLVHYGLFTSVIHSSLHYPSLPWYSRSLQGADNVAPRSLRHHYHPYGEEVATMM